VRLLPGLDTTTGKPCKRFGHHNTALTFPSGCRGRGCLCCQRLARPHLSLRSCKWAPDWSAHGVTVFDIIIVMIRAHHLLPEVTLLPDPLMLAGWARHSSSVLSVVSGKPVSAGA
jgi:hypothetical protein